MKVDPKGKPSPVKGRKESRRRAYCGTSTF